MVALKGGLLGARMKVICNTNYHFLKIKQAFLTLNDSRTAAVNTSKSVAGWRGILLGARKEPPLPVLQLES